MLFIKIVPICIHFSHLNVLSSYPSKLCFHLLSYFVSFLLSLRITPVFIFVHHFISSLYQIQWLIGHDNFFLICNWRNGWICYNEAKRNTNKFGTNKMYNSWKHHNLLTWIITVTLLCLVNSYSKDRDMLILCDKV